MIMEGNVSVPSIKRLSPNSNDVGDEGEDQIKRIQGNIAIGTLIFGDAFNIMACV